MWKALLILSCLHCIGVTVSIFSYPAGIPVSGYTNTFDYPILSRVALLCDVMQNHGLSFTVASYQWNTTGCYTNDNFNDGVPGCFPHGQTTQFVAENDLTAEDAGTITCTVTISNSNYTMNSKTFTLRVSGKQCIIVYIVHKLAYSV